MVGLSSIHFAIEKSSRAGAWVGLSMSISRSIGIPRKVFIILKRPYGPSLALNPSLRAVKTACGTFARALRSEHQSASSIDCTDVLDVLVNEGNGELSPKAWRKLRAATLGYTGKVFDNRVDNAKEMKLVTSSGNTQHKQAAAYIEVTSF
jgi:hypothetical protein